MASPVIEQEEIADLTRRLAEDQHKVKSLKLRLERASDGDSPLATLAVMRMDMIETQIEVALDALMRAAPALCAVTIPD